MKHRRLVAVIATATALVVPATAAQASSHSKSKFLSLEAEIEIHLGNADKAFKKLKKVAKLHSGKGVTKYLAIAKAENLLAAKKSRRLARLSTNKKQKAEASAQLIASSNELDDLIELVTDLVDEFGGHAGEELADSLFDLIKGHDSGLNVLEDLLDEVSDAVEDTLAAVLAALEVDDATEIINLDKATKSGHLSRNAEEKSGEALEILIDLLDEGFDFVQDELIPLLPEPLQKPLDQIVDFVDDTVENPETLEAVTEIVDSLLDSIPVLGDEGHKKGEGGLLGDDLLGDLLDKLLDGDLLEGLLGDEHGKGGKSALTTTGKGGKGDGGLLAGDLLGGDGLEGIGELVDSLLDGIPVISDLDLIDKLPLLGDNNGDGLLDGLESLPLIGDTAGDLLAVLPVIGGGEGGKDVLALVPLGGGNSGDGLLDGLTGGDGIIDTVTELVGGLLGHAKH